MPDIPGRRSRFGRYVAEFVVIFLGVWLSLLAEQWRQGREDRATEANALRGLVQDLQVDISDMSGNLARATRALEAADRLLDASDGPSREATEIAGLLSELGPCSFPQWNTSQYSTLKASGDLNLIRDQALRASIARYYEGLDGLAWLHDVDCAESRDLFAALPTVADLAVPQVPEPGRTREFSAVVVRVTEASAFRSESDYMDRIAKLASHREFLAHWVEQDLARAEALKAAIEAQLDRSAS